MRTERRSALAPMQLVPIPRLERQELARPFRADAFHAKRAAQRDAARSVRNRIRPVRLAPRCSLKSERFLLSVSTADRPSCVNRSEATVVCALCVSLPLLPCTALQRKSQLRAQQVRVPRNGTSHLSQLRCTQQERPVRARSRCRSATRTMQRAPKLRRFSLHVQGCALSSQGARRRRVGELAPLHPGVA